MAARAGVRSDRCGFGHLVRGRVLWSWLAGFLSVVVSGMTYCFPLYAEYFQTLGVKEAELNIIGNLQLTAAGLVVLPTALFHRHLSRRRSLRAADFWTSLVTGLMMVVGIGVIVIVCKTPLRGTGLVVFISIGLILNGAAVAVLAHTIWVMGWNLKEKPTLKRFAIASLSLGYGFGGFLFTILISAWPELTPKMDGWAWLLVQTTLSAAVMILRILFMYRNDVDAEAPPRGSASQVSGVTPSIWHELKWRLDAFWWSEGWHSALCSLMFMSVGIAIGLGITVNTVTASLLTTANYGVVGYPTSRDIFEAALTFLGSQVLGRIITLSLQGLGDCSHVVFIGGNAMQLAAFAMLWARGGEPTFFLISSAICGIALGISWTVWPLIVTLHFPGGVEAVQINFGLIFVSIAIFCPVLSACTDHILLATAPTIAGCEIVDGVDFRGPSCYDTVFMVYTMFALLALVTSSAAAAILVHRKMKRGKDKGPELQRQHTVE